MESSDNSGKLIWIGPADGGLGWLQAMTRRFCKDVYTTRRMSRVEQVSGFEELFRLAGHGTQRVIWTCQNRWDYPLQELSSFIAEFPDVPVGVAVSDWWLGWRRTGIGHLEPLPHVCLPWFRWWDGWFDWLAGNVPSMLGPFPANIPFSTERATDSVANWFEVASEKAQTLEETLGLPRRSRPGVSVPEVTQHSTQEPEDLSATQILLLGDCQLTLRSWQQLLGRKIRTEMFAGRMECDDSWKRLANSGKPLWILWDDSRLPTVRGAEACIDLAIRELSALAAQFPESRLWVAWSTPVWSDIQRMSDSGLHFELLAKPFLGNFSSAALDRI